MLFSYYTYRLVNNSLLYSDLTLGVGFLRHKNSQILNNEIWQVAFFIHALLSILVLLAGFTQFSRMLSKRHPSVHRWVGRLYCFNIIFIVGPAGFIMALYANGGVSGRLAFATLAVLWWLTTLKGYLAIRNNDILRHRKWMMYSFSLTLSAITFRIILQYFCSQDTTLLHHQSDYALAAWLGFVPNVLVAHWLNATLFK